MASKILHEGMHDAEFLLSEANGSFSREKCVILAGQSALVAGTLLTEDGTGKRVPWTPASATQVTSILYQNVPASTDDQEATEIVRSAEVMKTALTGYDPVADDDLAELGILLR